MATMVAQETGHRKITGRGATVCQAVLAPTVNGFPAKSVMPDPAPAPPSALVVLGSGGRCGCASGARVNAK